MRNSQPQPAFFSFKSIIENSKMKVRYHFFFFCMYMAKGIWKETKSLPGLCNQINVHQTERGE